MLDISNNSRRTVKTQQPSCNDLKLSTHSQGRQRIGAGKRISRHIKYGQDDDCDSDANSQDSTITESIAMKSRIRPCEKDTKIKPKSSSKVIPPENDEKPATKLSERSRASRRTRLLALVNKDEHTAGPTRRHSHITKDEQSTTKKVGSAIQSSSTVKTEHPDGEKEDSRRSRSQIRRTTRSSSKDGRHKLPETDAQRSYSKEPARRSSSNDIRRHRATSREGRRRSTSADIKPRSSTTDATLTESNSNLVPKVRSSSLGRMLRGEGSREARRRSSSREGKPRSSKWDVLSSRHSLTAELQGQANAGNVDQAASTVGPTEANPSLQRRSRSESRGRRSSRVSGGMDESQSSLRRHERNTSTLCENGGTTPQQRIQQPQRAASLPASVDAPSAPQSTVANSSRLMGASSTDLSSSQSLRRMPKGSAHSTGTHSTPKLTSRIDSIKTASLKSSGESNRHSQSQTCLHASSQGSLRWDSDDKRSSEQDGAIRPPSRKNSECSEASAGSGPRRPGRRRSRSNSRRSSIESGKSGSRPTPVASSEAPPLAESSVLTTTQADFALDKPGESSVAANSRKSSKLPDATSGGTSPQEATSGGRSAQSQGPRDKGSAPRNINTTALDSASKHSSPQNGTKKVSRRSSHSSGDTSDSDSRRARRRSQSRSRRHTRSSVSEPQPSSESSAPTMQSAELLSGSSEFSKALERSSSHSSGDTSASGPRRAKRRSQSRSRRSSSGNTKSSVSGSSPARVMQSAELKSECSELSNEIERSNCGAVGPSRRKGIQESSLSKEQLKSPCPFDKADLVLGKLELTGSQKIKRLSAKDFRAHKAHEADFGLDDWGCTDITSRVSPKKKSLDTNRLSVSCHGEPKKRSQYYVAGLSSLNNLQMTTEHDPRHDVLVKQSSAFSERSSVMEFEMDEWASDSDHEVGDKIPAQTPKVRAKVIDAGDQTRGKRISRRRTTCRKVKEEETTTKTKTRQRDKPSRKLDDPR